jgi:hypothetical protein
VLPNESVSRDKVFRFSVSLVPPLDCELPIGVMCGCGDRSEATKNGEGVIVDETGDVDKPLLWEVADD